MESNIAHKKTSRSSPTRTKRNYRVVQGYFGGKEKIPATWCVLTVSEISKKITSGGTPSTTIPEYWNGSIPWTRSAILTERYINSGEKYITKQGIANSSSTIIPKNNLLISSRVSIGNMSINNIDIAISQDVTGIIVDTNKVIPEYLYWYFKNNLNIFTALSQGTTIQGFTKYDLGRLPVFLPPLAEQRKIASIPSNVDTLIYATQQVIDNTVRLKTGLMQKLFTSGINNTTFKTAKSFFDKHETIPMAWKMTKLIEVGDLIGGGTPSSTNKKYWDGDILWAIPTDITRMPSNFITDTEKKITAIGLNESSATLLPPGSILITSRATIGECAINTRPMATNQGFQNLICNKNNHNLFWLYALRYHKKQMLRLAHGTTFLEIGKNAMQKIMIPCPRLNEQQRIASILSGIDAYIDVNRVYVKNLQLLKKSLVYNLFTAKIQV